MKLCNWAAECARDDESDYTYKIVVYLRSRDDDMKMSSQCFAGMLIHFRFDKFLALRTGPICSKVMAKFCVIQPRCFLILLIGISLTRDCQS